MYNRKIGINKNCINIPDAEAVRLMAENGFSATFADSEDESLERYISLCRDAGIACETLHAPYDRINDMWFEGEAGENMLERLINALETCARFEVPTAIVHLSSGDDAPRINDLGYSRYAALMERADSLGVTVAYENQRKLANLAFAFEVFPTARFCWDTGHEACFARGLRFMPLFGDKLCALHIHDNNGEHNADLHMLPFDGKLDFDAIAGYLAKSSYTGTLMLEVIAGKTPLYLPMTPGEYYARAASAASRLCDMIDAAAKTL